MELTAITSHGWYPSEFQYKGHTFKSIEQAYQCEKATRANDANWDKDKKDVMKELVRIKFSDNPELLKELIDTKDLILVEAGIDPFYGVGLSITNGDILDPTKWKGQNQLGQILCGIRAALKDKQ